MTSPPPQTHTQKKKRQECKAGFIIPHNKINQEISNFLKLIFKELEMTLFCCLVVSQ